jgi:hypothetical protein
MYKVKEIVENVLERLVEHTILPAVCDKTEVRYFEMDGKRFNKEMFEIYVRNKLQWMRHQERADKPRERDLTSEEFEQILDLDYKDWLKVRDDDIKK